MRCFRRIIMGVAILGAGVALAGCGSLDPTDWFDFDRKKPIPGERRLVFPEGVPGVPQGVPPDLVRGSEPPVDPAMITSVDGSKPAEGAQPAASTTGAAAAAAARPAAKPKPRVASRPKVKKQATTPAPSAPQPAAQPASQQPDSAIWGPPPGQGAAAPWPAPATQRAPGAPWPDPPNPNTFSR
jgi:hypothetical protein